MDHRRVEDDWLDYLSALRDIELRDVEIRVARYVSLGRTNARIAKELDIPLSTVKWHIRTLFLKLGVPDRYALAESVQNRVAALRGPTASRGTSQGPGKR